MKRGQCCVPHSVVGECSRKGDAPTGDSREAGGVERQLELDLGCRAGETGLQRPDLQACAQGFILRALGSHGRLEGECALLLLSPAGRWLGGASPGLRVGKETQPAGGDSP